MLKNKKSEISKVLSSMATPRRIVLTGTPLQNNLLEFYRMADWIRPGCLGSESAFEKKFALKIMSSLTSDASLETQQLGEQLLRELFDTLSPYIQRLDSSVLKRELPHIQQAVIHVRQTKAQMKLYRAFKKFQKNSTSNNFLEQYSKLFPVNNHPGALLFRGSGSSNRQAKPHNNKGRPALSKNSVSKAIPAIDIAKVTVKSETFRKPTANNEENGDQVISNSQGSVEVIIIDDSSDDENNEAAVAAEVIDDAIEGDQEEDWWKKVVHNLDDIQNGGKAILLLQILAHSEMIGKKYSFQIQLQSLMVPHDLPTHVPR
jgi:SNF2 family DNA or RNA helicase